MSEKNKMTSIARKINLEFWTAQFSNYIMLDLLIFIIVLVSFFVYWEGLVPDGQEIVNRTFTGDSFASSQYVIEAGGRTYEHSIAETFALIKRPAIVILVVEGCSLVIAFFHTGKVRNMMKPLNDIAVKTEALSNMDFESEKFENIEAAISSLDTDAPDAHVTTGDADLRSLEIAINNLIDRMRESQKQQQRFVSDASHELRTPISVIQGYVNMLDRWGKEDEKILAESIEAIKNESEHMKDLIEQLLFLARGDSGRHTLRFTQVDLTEMVKDVKEESEMIDARHPYVFEGPDYPVKAEADLSMLKQSLRILVQNAAKYTSEGEKISLRVKEIDGKPAFIVQDEGIGMSEKDVIHIFERFYRAEPARQRSEGGTGLGLSIAKWIVDAHNGQIQVLSRPQFGTRFTIILPPKQEGLS